MHDAKPPSHTTEWATATLAALLFAGTAQAASITAVYSCSDGSKLTATFNTPANGPGSVTLVPTKGSKPLTLPQVLSADGGRYAAGDTEFWSKGKGASFTRAGRALTCLTKS